MTYFEILVPLFFGALLIASPQTFTKASGYELERARLKLKKIGFLLIAVAAGYSVVKVMQTPAQITTGKPRSKMHRVQATTPGDSGWYLAESTEGSFSVRLPIPFNDFTVTANDPKMGMIAVHTVGGLSAEGIKFSATEMPRAPGTNPLDLNDIAKNLETRDQKVSALTNGSYAGWPSISFELNSAKSGAFMRAVQTRSKLITLILEYPPDRQSDAARLKPRFLDSLRFKSANTN